MIPVLPGWTVVYTLLKVHPVKSRGLSGDTFLGSQFDFWRNESVFSKKVLFVRTGAEDEKSSGSSDF